MNGAEAGKRHVLSPLCLGYVTVSSANVGLGWFFFRLLNWV